ncbi:MAG: MMPL family transporter [Gammaproteobacteria bacterium]|nr:MMPL family transporter [Gammaproteobacteria bacterium]
MRRYLPLPIAWLVFALLIAIPAWLLSYLRFDNAPEAYLPADAPSVIFEKELRRQFPGYELEVVLFEGLDLFEEAFLSKLDKAVALLERHEQVERVIAPTRMDHITGTADGFSVEPLLGAKQRARLNPEQRRARALADRFAPGMVVSRDGSALALIVRPKSLPDSLSRIRLHEDIGAALQTAGLSERVSARAGQLPLDVVQFQSMLKDNATFVPATITVGLSLVWLLFRRLLAVLLCFLMIIASLHAAVAMLVVLDKPFTLVSSILPPFMAALTVASMVHLFSAQAHAAAAGKTGRTRVEAALGEVTRPSFFAILTTVSGLLSLALSTIQPIRYFGLAGAFGMLLLFCLMIYILPALLERYDRRPWPLHQRGGGGMQRLVDALSHLSLRHAGWLALAFLAATLAGLPLLGKLRAETDLYKFFSEDSLINRATHAVENRLSGVMPLDLVFEAEGRDSLLEPKRLELLRDIRDEVTKLPGVDRSLSMIDILEDMHWAFNGEDPAFRVLPTAKPLIAQYLLLYDGKDLYELANREFSRTRISLALRAHDTASLRALMTDLESRLNSRDLAGMRWRFASEARIFTEQERLLVDGQINGIWGSVATIFAFMLLLARSFGAALICMIVNVTPVVFVFMLMGALAIPLDMATALIACIAVGIAIDDTVHTFANAQGHLAAGAGITLAIARTYREAGRAVTITTIILCSQFFLLIASGFIPTREFGFLTGFGLGLAFLFDLLLMPSLLVLRHRLLAPMPAMKKPAEAG